MAVWNFSYKSEFAFFGRTRNITCNSYNYNQVRESINCTLSSQNLQITSFPPNLEARLQQFNNSTAKTTCSWKQYCNRGAQIINVSSASSNHLQAAFPSDSKTAGDIFSFPVVNINDTGFEAAGATPIVHYDNCCKTSSVQIDGNSLAPNTIKNAYSSFLTSDGSVSVHAGERLGRSVVSDAIATPIVHSSTYFFNKTAEIIDFKEKKRASFEYGRYGNPTTAVAEEKIGALEGAESTLFMASGMCANTVMLLALVPVGGHIVTTSDCYKETRTFIETFLPKMGITATVIDPADLGALESALNKNKVSLFFTESPTNPFLRCVDIELVSKLCHKKGALVCVDGTIASPLNQKALALGADLVLHSATKFIGGHSDVVAGCISGSEKLISYIRDLHRTLGGALNPNAAYLIIRGMKTLHLRVQQQNSTAMRMSEILEGHPKVRRVYYPGLPTHPDHHIAKKQMIGFGGVVSFEVDGDMMTTAKFIDALQIPYIATSFGGCESLVDQPVVTSYWNLSQSVRNKYGILDSLVRFSFGIEDFEDLKADILQALEFI